MIVKTIQLKLDQNTFQYLEVLVYGLMRQNFKTDEEREVEAAKIHNKKNDDFGPGVSRLLEEIAESLAVGVRRTGSWENGTLSALTGWDGTVVPAMYGELVELESTPCESDK